MFEREGYRVLPIDGGGLWLDGGAMFGNVPRVLWEREHPADAKHRIRLAARVLFIEGHGRRILVDTGTGHLWNEKEMAMYGVLAPARPPVVQSLLAEGIDPASITDVVLTHLHFDHAGGISERGPDGEPRLTFPAAMHHVQRANYDNARAPNARERASYLERHLAPLAAAKLALIEGAAEILPGIFTTRSDGHTVGLQTVRIGAGRDAVLFPADLSPLAAHVQVPWTMGYDMCAQTVMREKAELFERAVGEDWILVLEHDPERAAARLQRDERGRLSARPV